VRINDVNNNYFVAGKDLKQWDPLSPILFNFMSDVFTKILYKVVANNLIQGLLPQVVPVVSSAFNTRMIPSYLLNKTLRWPKI
jgi:hypothetical protein